MARASSLARVPRTGGWEERHPCLSCAPEVRTRDQSDYYVKGNAPSMGAVGATRVTFPWERVDKRLSKRKNRPQRSTCRTAMPVSMLNS